MANVNQVIIIGYMGKDTQVSTTQSGVKVARISVGTTEKGYTTKSGTQVEDRTDWHDVVLWRQSAEFAEKYAHKGSQVYVRGKLRHRTYQDKDGQTRYVTEIECEDFQILDRMQSSSTGVQPHQPQANNASAGQETRPPFASDDNLPF